MHTEMRVAKDTADAARVWSIAKKLTEAERRESDQTGIGLFAPHLPWQ